MMSIDDLSDEQLRELVSEVDKFLWDTAKERRIEPLALFSVLLARNIWLAINLNYMDDIIAILEHAIDDYMEHPEDYLFNKEPANNNHTAEILQFPKRDNDDGSKT